MLTSGAVLRGALVGVFVGLALACAQASKAAAAGSTPTAAVATGNVVSPVAPEPIPESEGPVAAWAQPRIGGAGRSRAQPRIGGAGRSRAQPRIGGAGRSRARPRIGGAGRSRAQSRIGGGRSLPSPVPNRSARSLPGPCPAPSRQTTHATAPIALLSRLERDADGGGIPAGSPRGPARTASTRHSQHGTPPVGGGQPRAIRPSAVRGRVQSSGACSERELASRRRGRHGPDEAAPGGGSRYREGAARSARTA